jgi:hypothetical protein
MPNTSTISASDVIAIVGEAGIELGTKAESWAADTTRGQENQGLRTPAEWAAFYLTGDVETLRRSHSRLTGETPAKKRDWGGKVHIHANTLLKLLDVTDTRAPAAWDAVAPALLALADPGRRPLALPSTEDLQGRPMKRTASLLPFLSEMSPQTVVHPGYIAGLFEDFTLKSVPAISRFEGRSETPAGPILSDALRMTVVGLQIMTRCAQELVKCHPEKAPRPENHARAFLYFARQVQSIYCNLTGKSPKRPDSDESLVKFYRGVARQALSALTPNEAALDKALRGRADNKETAKTDLRDAQGGRPRKR